MEPLLKDYRKAVIIALALCLLPVAGYGATLCGLDFGALGGKIRVKGLKNERAEARLRAAVEKIDSVVGHLKTPRRLRFSFQEKGASFLPATDEIELSLRLAEDLPTLQVLAEHEYGHAVFYANAGRAAENMNWDWASRPYQELFADFLLTVAHRDPERIAKAVAELGATERKAAARRFAGAPQAAVFTEGEEHMLFSPARTFLWETYFANGRNEGNEGEITEKVLAVLLDEISRQPRDSDPVPALMNVSLMNALRRALAAYE